MKSAVVGFRVHSGWTSLVVVALEKGKPIVLVRQRPHLVETFSYVFRQPYHTAQKMSLGEAEEFLERQRKEARVLAGKALRAVQQDVAQQRYKLKRAVLLTASGRPLPELAKILAAHSLIHTADGEFFREAILRGCEKARITVELRKERDLVTSASLLLKRKPAALLTRVTELGKPVGAPWSQDEKFATLAAWVTLCPGQNHKH